ncbi:uncharacterized mitochondrial protein AtMg00810-like [Glycine max]|uniref:uncharacterized mitochondrial protein AtMg00810-like n=1 Tax=Glycine max TaxID=3847 RepID=UPI0003DECAA0|nr:uncharacterized mitochondrial protein AtMg00810-like [Glycine max]|eukprot:XP_006579262.1 uncharacterized protein LOC102663997 [Glycine max]
MVLKDFRPYYFSLGLLQVNMNLHPSSRRVILTVYLLVSVDDIIITGSSISLIQHLTSQLNSKFSLKQLCSLDYFLGIEVITLSNKSLLLTQSKYIRDLLQMTSMTEDQSISSPMASRCKLTKIGSDMFSDPTLFMFVVGAL